MKRKPFTHDLKCWPEYFEAIRSGTKTFEVRLNDRGFLAGDVLHLHEWDPQKFAEIRREGNRGLGNMVATAQATGMAYTGRSLWRRVTYIMDAASPHCALIGGYVCMAIVPCRKPRAAGGGK